MEQNTQTQFQGSHISRIPHQPGLYAWYYKPSVIDKQTVSKTLLSFLETPIEISSSIQMRYGVHLVSTSPLNLVYGKQQESALKVLQDAIECADTFFLDFLNSYNVQNFTRPIYIGIAKNLYKRVYGQHYLPLTEMWDDNSSITRHLTAYPVATVQSIMDTLNLPHSFALEARARTIAPRDLIVHIFPTNNLPTDIGSDNNPNSESQSRRALERVLQLIADPICGRR